MIIEDLQIEVTSFITITISNRKIRTKQSVKSKKSVKSKNYFSKTKVILVQLAAAVAL